MSSSFGNVNKWSVLRAPVAGGVAFLSLLSVLSVGPAAAFSADCAGERAALKARIDDMITSRDRDGNIRGFEDGGFLSRYPLMASLAWRIYEADRDAGFLQDVFEADVAYVNFLLAHYDADGDFLVEGTPGAAGPDRSDVEDVGFNAMLALEMRSLARVAAELQRPIEALFWYRGMQTVSGRLIDECYDVDAGFFLPMNNRLQRHEGSVLSMSALPIYFDTRIGDNLAASIIRNYLLRGDPSQPETPSHDLNWTPGPAAAASAEPLLRAMLLADALAWNGFDDDAHRVRGALAERVAANTRRGAAKPYTDYLACRVARRPYGPLLPRYTEFDLLTAVSRMNGVLRPAAWDDLARAIGVVRAFLSLSPGKTTPRGGQRDPAEVDKAVRDVYWAVSSMRDKWRRRTLFSAEDRDRMPGFDVYGSFSLLLDDVASTLRRAETRLSEGKTDSGGFRIAATLVNEVIAPGEAANVRFALSAANAPVDITSILVTHDQAVDTLIRRPVTLRPGQPREYWYRYPLGREAARNVRPLHLSALVKFGDGRRLRYHYNRSVYITPRVTYTVTFPQGPNLRGSTVPIRIDLRKHVQKRLVVNAEWYSPAGLRLKQGSSMELVMPATEKRMAVDMDVLVPRPCRPGAFPFVIKVFGNGDDAGTVSASMFKHYQWIFAGPFPARRNAIDTEYPPEQGVNLRERYRGARGPISWAALPPRAYVDDGAVDLTSFMPPEGVCYLYTVIKTAADMKTVAIISATGPSVLFVNGAELARFPGPTPAPQRAPVSLAAGMNTILIKLLPTTTRRMFFQLGEEEDLTSDEFNNNLWELVDGYQEFHDRGALYGTDTESPRIVTLRFHDPTANSVAVIGSFNGWSPVNTAMRADGHGGWEISLHLTPGRYAYRFLINNNQQIIDPRSPYQEPDGYGGKNSVLLVK